MKEKSHISLIIILLSITLFACYHIYYYFMNQKSEILIDSYFSKSERENNILPMVNNIKENETIKEEYFGIIEIPKINLKEGFYEKESKYNNVNHSVTLLKESIMPNNSNSIIYLAAHSGSGPLAYFKNLNQLTNEDRINLLYKNEKYSYVIVDIYEYPRKGNIIINRNIHEDYLVLTTCSNHKDMQIVIVSKLINKV